MNNIIACCVLAAAFVAGNCASAAAEPASAVFDKIGAEALATQKTPGFSFVVLHDGKVIYAKGFGLADVEKKIPVTAQTRFAIGSISKQFTAAAVLLLARRGKLDLDDPLSKYLPAFPNGSEISLRMLLNQTSGLHNYPLGEHHWQASGTIPLDSLVSLLASDKPDFAPGTKWEYSNTNYTLLAAVIAKVSGISEATFLQRNFFDPLKMTASGFGYAAQRRPGLAKAYQGNAPPFVPQSPISLDLYSGAGAVVSSGPDLASWDLALVQGTLLDPSGMQALWTAGKLKSGASTPYAMGFVPAILGGHREVWHNGLTPGAGGYCYNAIFPDDKLAVIVLSNGYAFEEVPERMAGQVLAAYVPAVAAHLAPATRPTPAPGEVRSVTARAQDWWHRLQTATVDLSQVEPSFAARLTPEFLAQIKAALANAGSPTDWIYQGSQSVSGATIYSYWIRLNGVPHMWSIGLTADGKISGSYLQ